MTFRIVTVTPPGRFPTVIFDQGTWWDVLDAEGEWNLERLNVNHAWWFAVCSSSVREIVLAPLSWSQSVRRQTEWLVNDVDLKSTGREADNALRALMTPTPYRSLADYVHTISCVSHHLAALNASQRELVFSVDAGVRVADLNYADSSALTVYAARDTFLSRSISRALQDLGQCDFLALHVTSPEDLLTALVIAFLVRQRAPATYICLFDHGYENFSLHAHMDSLRGAGTLDAFFDAIIESKDERDTIMPALTRSVRNGHAPRGYLRIKDVPGVRPYNADLGKPAPPVPTFSPEPVLWTRLSKRRCYWSRCTFCAQNTKYDDPGAPMHAEIPETVKRVAKFRDLGYRTFIFSDEAISPSSLGHLCRQLEERRIDVRWACRCKLEKAFSAELFERMGRVGCYEILYGLETVSERVLKLMDKFVPGMDEDRIAEIFSAMDRADIGLHVNLIGGFPGDRPQDSRASVDFVVRAIRDLRGATYILNAFALFPDTPILKDPDRFGITPIKSDGDMPSSYDFGADNQIGADMQAVYDEIPKLRNKLDTQLGWARLTAQPAGAMAVGLYFGFGHGAIFKAAGRANPFANPLTELPESRMERMSNLP